MSQLNDQLLDDIFNDAERPEISVPNDNVIKTIANLAKSMQELEQQIELANEHSETLSKRYNEIRLKQLPEAMSGAQLEKFTLSNGYEVGVTRQYYASISDDNRDEALKWFREAGFGDLIKSQLHMEFSKGSDAVVQKIVAFLRKNKVPFSLNDGINANTLKAFVKEKMEKGVEIPEKLLGVFTQDVAKLKLAKAKADKTNSASKRKTK